MRVILRNVLSALRVTLSMGLIGFLFAPLLHALEYPADITRALDSGAMGFMTAGGTSWWQSSNATPLCRFTSIQFWSARSPSPPKPGSSPTSLP